MGYALRLAMLAMLGLTLLQFLISAAFSALSAAPGLEFFKLIVATNLLFTSICGIVVFASAITEEKEVGSLGLLMMTGLTPLSTLLSKGVSKLLVGVALILAQLPFSILAVTLGGVGRMQIVAAYAAIVAYMFLVGNLALFFSVVCARTHKAMTFTFLALLGFNILVAIFPETRWLSPAIRVADILSTGFAGPVFSAFEWGCFGISAALFAVALAIFDSVSRNTGDCEAAPRSSLTINKKGFRVFPVPRAWKNALAWKEHYFTSGGSFGMTAVVLVVALSIAFSAVTRVYATGLSSLTPLFVGCSMMAIGTALLFFQCLYVSSTVLGAEVHEKTYSALALLPMTKRVLAYRKFQGAMLFALPSVACFFVGLVLAAINITPDELFSKDAFMFVGMAVPAVLQSVFYFYLTAYFSLKIRFGAFIVAAVAHLAIQLCLGFPAIMASMFAAAITSVLGDAWAQAGFLIVNTAFMFLICGFAIVLLHRVIGRELDVAAGA